MTTEQRQEARGLIRQGLSDSKVAEWIGCARPTITAIRRELLACERCAEPLREPDHLCGFCIGETSQQHDPQPERRAHA